ncbi:small ubiquitin protein [Perkinsela sp. CCAP 1560/4]|nr:small ubiquitin protein [Perkinsela sp. CCAP 1560/4]|eukprot:KNH09674.1 small ubiquitin protein [Perkinsela sp. CCAP 1560/4]
MSEEESKSSEVKQEAAEQVSLKVVNGEGLEVFFKIKKRVRLGKLLDAYCVKQGINRNSVRFLYDGNPIDEDKTAEDLEMEDDDIIDAMIEQIGGCCLI